MTSPPDHETEAVISFRVQRSDGAAPGATVAARQLDEALRAARGLGIVGREPGRYGGLAFGNISFGNVPGRFWITGTQTADSPELGPEQVVEVSAWQLATHRLTCRGALDPSSETMTHAALHEVLGTPLWVVHGHAPQLWSRAAELGWPTTPAAAANGTPAMARAVSEAIRSDSGLIAMGGHRDGVLAFAAARLQALRLLRDALAASATRPRP